MLRKELIWLLFSSDENGEVQALKQEAEQLKAETAVAVQERDDQVLCINHWCHRCGDCCMIDTSRYST